MKIFLNYSDNNFLNFILISLMIITYPINFKIILFMRIVDIVSLIFIFINYQKIQNTQIKVIIMIIVALMISSLVGFYFNLIFNILDYINLYIYINI